MTLGKRIAYYRRVRGMTQQELAEKLDVTVTTISNYEHDRRAPSYEQLEAIADWLNVSMAELLGGKGQEKGNDEISEYLEELRTRPEMRMLFSVAKGAKRIDIERAVAIIEALVSKGKK